jgi:hypothetical protein
LVSNPYAARLLCLINKNYVYLKENIKEIAIKKISSELGMNERAVLKIIKIIFIQINNFFKNFITFFLKKYIYILELLQFYKKYGGKVRCLKFNIKKPKKTEVVSTPAFYFFLKGNHSSHSIFFVW